MNQQKKLENLKRLSILLDTKFTGPFGMTFGLDALIGLVPVLGDFVTSCFSFYIIFRAALMGCAPSTLIRMVLNVLVENLADMIPVVGNLFDFIWKANTKNLLLLQNHLLQPRQVTYQSRLFLGMLLLIFFSIMGLAAWVSWAILAKIFAWF